MKVLIGADMVPTKSNEKLFIDGSVEELVGQELLDLINNSDYRIFNLETPLTDNANPIKKSGPHLMAKTANILGYKKLGCNLLTVANNHILDQGVDGLLSTLSILEQEEISHVGAGNNLFSAKQPITFVLDNKTIGVYACAEHEFSIAHENTPGANPFDILQSFDHVKELKEKCDFVIVLYHGGMEYYRYPSPNLQLYCRKFVDKGADLVICQHSHCIGCYEEYNSKTIVYGQGNFIFDDGNDEFWNSSLLVEISKDFKISFIPLKKNDNTVRLAKGNEKEKILADFLQRSQQIKEPNFVETQYHIFSTKKLESYYSRSLGGIRYSILFKVLNKLTKKKIIYSCFREKHSLSLLNSINCEAHRELFIDGLREQIYGGTKET